MTPCTVVSVCVLQPEESSGPGSVGDSSGGMGTLGRTSGGAGGGSGGSGGGGMDNIMSEIQKKLAQRRAKADNSGQVHMQLFDKYSCHCSSLQLIFSQQALHWLFVLPLVIDRGTLYCLH